MRALCWHGKGDVRCDTTPDPKIEHPRDAIIKVTSCAICGSDLHFIDGYTHAFGGYAGAPAQYVRIPFADNDCFKVLGGVADKTALFLSDTVPIGYMGADFCNIQPGDTVAVWGCGGVGLMAHTTVQAQDGRLRARGVRAVEAAARRKPARADEVIMARFTAACAALAMTLFANGSFAQQQAAPSPGGAAQLQLVASFEHQVTGVTIAPDGRIFVNFPRWTEDAPISVAEVTRDGQIKAYPDDQWNSWRNAKKNQISAGDHFVCVQSVVADARGNLWVVDPAAPATAPVVPGGPKLVRIDLKANKVAEVIHFDETVAPQGSYLNDVRFSPDGRHAYLTDAGAKGALVVVDLQTGKGRRVLDGHPSTQPEKDVVVKTDGQELRRPDGRGVEFAADSLALSPDGRTLYWKALTGRTLYRMATDSLENPRLSEKDLEARVERAGETEPTDGLWIDGRERLYLSAIEQDAVKVRDGDRITTLVQDKRLRWPDTFSEGPDGTVYVTSSRIQDMSWFKPENGPRLQTQLWRIEGTGTRRP